MSEFPLNRPEPSAKSRWIGTRSAVVGSIRHGGVRQHIAPWVPFGHNLMPFNRLRLARLCRCGLAPHSQVSRAAGSQLPRFSRLRMGALVGLVAAASAGCGAPPLPAVKPAVASPAWFQEVAASAGLTARWAPEGNRPLTNLQSFGNGCAFFDADDDGWQDILLVSEPSPHLYLNLRNGMFRDHTREAGLHRVRGPWKGCAVGDYDADGRMDILLTGFNEICLLGGRPGPEYADVTRTSGLRPSGWGSSAGFMDLDSDGDLDLLVGNYVVLDAQAPRYCEMKPGVTSGCPPHTYRPQYPRLYRNDGKGSFTDVTRSSGVGEAGGKVLALGFTDYDRDGLQDFYLANDGVPGDFFQNLGGMRFRNVAVSRGVALGVFGQAQAGMGVDWGDYDRDGRQDLVVTAFSDEPYSVYRDQGSYFENVSARLGIAEPTTKPLGFGTKWLDFNNDGWLDLIFANGHVYDNVADFDAASAYRQPVQLFRNRMGKHFEDVGTSAGPDLAKPIVGRGLAVADYDRDGRLDLLVVDREGTPLLLRNTMNTAGNWLTLDLRNEGPNRFAYGARVVLPTPSGPLLREVSPASSFLSSSAAELHFGLGELREVEGLQVVWPDGKMEEIACGAVNRRVVVHRGKKSVQ